MTVDEVLDGFERTTFDHDGSTRQVFKLGTGPAVIVMAEMPGITPKVLWFARQVADQGLTAVVPHLFGEPGKEPGTGIAAMATMWRSIVPACVSREFVVLATGKTSPVVAWLRALARAEHERCGGPGVGAVGMCFTGGFALGMAVDEHLLAPVLSQPSLPLAVSGSRRRSIDVSDADLQVVRGRCQAGDLEVMGLRFTSDRLVGADRFAFLREQLGDAFIGIELPHEAGAPVGMSPHSVLTEHLIDEPGEPTREALDQVLAFLVEKLT